MENLFDWYFHDLWYVCCNRNQENRMATFQILFLISLNLFFLFLLLTKYKKGTKFIWYGVLINVLKVIDKTK